MMKIKPPQDLEESIERRKVREAAASFPNQPQGPSPSRSRSLNLSRDLNQNQNQKEATGSVTRKGKVREKNPKKQIARFAHGTNRNTIMSSSILTWEGRKKKL